MTKADFYIQNSSHLEKEFERHLEFSNDQLGKLVQNHQLNMS